MAKYEITILINVLRPSPVRGQRRGQGQYYVFSPSIFISNSRLGWGPLVDHLVVWLFTFLSPRQAGCKVRDLRQFRHLSISRQSSHSGCVEEIFSYKHLSCITAALPVRTCCLAYISFPGSPLSSLLSVILNKHQHNTNNEWKLDPS